MAAADVPKLVAELTSTISLIHETIATISSHEKTSENLSQLEAQCEADLSAISQKYDQEATTLQNVRRKKREELLERRRKEDEEIRLRRAREDQEIQEMEKSEDDDMRDRFDKERDQVEDRTENDIDAVEEEAQKRVEEGQARLAELEARRKVCFGRGPRSLPHHGGKVLTTICNHRKSTVSSTNSSACRYQSSPRERDHGARDG